jgi:hypothetical protein
VLAHGSRYFRIAVPKTVPVFGAGKPLNDSAVLGRRHIPGAKISDEAFQDDTIGMYDEVHCDASLTVSYPSVLQFYEAHQATSNVVVFIMSVRQLPETFSLSVTRRPRLRSLEPWLDVSPQAAIPHSTDKNIVTAIVNGADVRSTLS